MTIYLRGCKIVIGGHGHSTSLASGSAIPEEQAVLVGTNIAAGANLSAFPFTASSFVLQAARYVHVRHVGQGFM